MNDLIAVGPVSPLRQRLIDDMTMRRFSRETQRNYLRDVGRFATWLGRSPHTATAEDVRRFQIEQQDAGATLAQRAYGIDNPNGWIDYSGDIWGWTASDGPGAAKGREVGGTERRFMAYAARGVSSERVVDDGTIVPTAAGGSIPFALEITIPALKAMKDRYGARLYSRYGFKDAC